jgi:leucyl aminopeptidase (aminopeptidase T)
VISDLEKRVVKKVISQSLRLKKGESVTVETWNNGLTLARQFVIEARRIGASPIMIFEDEDAYVDGVKNAPKDMVGKMGKHEYQLLASTDAYFFIPNPVIGDYTKRLSLEEVDQSTAYNDSWYEAAEKEKLRGVRMSYGFAGEEVAGILGKSRNDIIIHQLRAALVDFEKIKTTGKMLEVQLSKNGAGTLTSNGAELEFEFQDGVELEDGIVDEEDIATGQNVAYMPPGMLTKKFKTDSVRGKVKVSPTQTRLGIIKDAVLEFENGRLAGWSSGSSGKWLDSLINSQSENERKVGHLTIGLNPLMRYGYAQDRFVDGSLGITGLEFTGIVRNGSLRVGQSIIINGGKLQS